MTRFDLKVGGLYEGLKVLCRLDLDLVLMTCLRRYREN